jgi:hypothetical protein
MNEKTRLELRLIVPFEPEARSLKPEACNWLPFSRLQQVIVAVARNDVDAEAEQLAERL